MKDAEDLKPGRELDALVATKVMGWTLRRFWPVSDLRDDRSKPCESWTAPGGTYERQLPAYSTDIAAAWEVVEKFEVVELIKGEEFARCRIRVGKGHPAYEKGNDWVTDESDTSAIPHAICLAALKAVAK